MAQYSGSAIQTPPVKGEAKEAAAEEKELVKEVPVKESAAVPLLVSPPPTARPRERLELESRSEGNGRYKKIKSKEGLREGTRAYRSLRSNTCENLSAIPAEYARPKSRYAKPELEEQEPEVLAAAAPQPVIQIDCPPSPEEEVVSPPPSSPPAPSPPPLTAFLILENHPFVASSPPSVGSRSSFFWSGFLATFSLTILLWKLFMRTVTSLAPSLLSVFSCPTIS